MVAVIWQIFLVVGVASAGFYLWLTFTGKKTKAIATAPLFAYRDVWIDEAGIHELKDVECIDEPLDRWILVDVSGYQKVVYCDEIVPVHNIRTMAKQNTDSERGMWIYHPNDTTEATRKDAVLSRETTLKEEMKKYATFVWENQNVPKIHTDTQVRPDVREYWKRVARQRSTNRTSSQRQMRRTQSHGKKRQTQ